VTSGRRAAREAALLLLFAAETARITDAEDLLSTFKQHFRGDAEVMSAVLGGDPDSPEDKLRARAEGLFAEGGTRWQFVERLVRGALGHLVYIDELLTRCSINWKVPRMARVDRNILRLAAYELAFEADVPSRVTLNEYIELAKRYGTEESGAFVNGILDRVAQELERV
jgi:N utilization substance protein B